MYFKTLKIKFDDIKDKKSYFKLQSLVAFSIFFICLFVLPNAADAATIYIDGNLSSNCSSNYSISGRSCSGTDGNAFNTVSGGIGAANAGDTLYIREGTYNIITAINISYSSDLTTTIQGYGSETITLNSNIDPSMTIFNLSATTQNVNFKNIKFVGLPYKIITGWTNYSGNVWTASAICSTQIRFNITNGTVVGSIALVNSANKYYCSSGTIYAYSVGDPTTTYTSPGINIADDFSGIAIGSPSNNAAGNLITIDNCVFQDFSHAGIKGTWKWHIKNSKFLNIGTDGLDHDIYANGVQTSGNEMVFEYNYFGYAPGAAIHLYSSPAYAVVRYNIFNGLSGSNRGSYGVLAAGSNHKIYNNTFYGYGSGGGVTLYHSSSQNNIIKNNIFSNNTADLLVDAGGASYPTNNIVETNYFGSSTKCTGCTDYTGSSGPNLSTLDDSPPNIYSTSPWTQFTYTFHKATTGATSLTFFNACGGGASPTTGSWYLDDISLIPVGGGAEKIINGNMEGTFTGGIAASWGAFGGTTGNQENSVSHGGTSSQKLSVTGGCGSRFEQSITLAAGDYILSGWAKRDSGTGTLPVYIAGVNTSFTIGTIGPSFLGTLAYSDATDFKIDPSGADFSLVTDTGQNLSSSHQLGLNSALTIWPLGTINQNYFGSGWDLGAFVYNNDSTVQTSTASTSSNTGSSSSTSYATTPSCGDAMSTSAPDLYQISVSKDKATLDFAPPGDPYNKIFISYGLSPDAEQFGVEYNQEHSSGSLYYTINELAPNVTYYFKVRGGNGCMPGPWSRIMKVKTDTKNSHGGLVYYAYYEMVKRLNNLVGFLK